MDVIKKPRHISMAMPYELNEMLEKFQAEHFLETKTRMTKQQVIHRALEVYISKVYELSREELNGK